tara:strand:- start:25 stop:159 length:135 start_codon:yes stop_codon:yes gene_type:complete
MTEREFQEMNDFEEELESAINTVTKIVAVFVGIVLATVAYYLIF